jgi:hypothetical protein
VSSYGEKKTHQQQKLTPAERLQQWQAKQSQQHSVDSQGSWNGDRDRDGFAGSAFSRSHFKPPRPASAASQRRPQQHQRGQNIQRGQNSRGHQNRRPSDQAMFRKRAAQALAADMAAVQDLQ